MGTVILTILATALVTACVTAAAIFLLLRNYLLPKVQQSIDTEVLPALQDRVKQGVLDAGEELLPAFRGQVRDGFTDALRDAASGGLVEETVRSAAKKFEDGIGSFLGGKPRG